VRKTSGPKKDDVLSVNEQFSSIARNGDLQNCFNTDVQEATSGWAFYLGREDKESIQNFDGEPLGKRPLGIVRSWWKDNIKIDLTDIGCEDGRLMKLGQDRVQWRLWK
jgi:hypothetical protein